MLAFRLARLIVWTGMFVAGIARGNKPLWAFGIGAAVASLVSFAVDAWRDPS